MRIRIGLTSSEVLAARFLLDANFPESLHPDSCGVVGLDLEATRDLGGHLRRALILVTEREAGRT